LLIPKRILQGAIPKRILQENLLRVACRCRFSKDLHHVRLTPFQLQWTPNFLQLLAAAPVELGQE
jgi:hypothetical protein